MSEIINKIFSEDRPTNANQPSGSVIKKDRLQLLSPNVAKELNTYRNWGLIYLGIEPVITGLNGDTVMANPLNILVTKSIFNNINATPIMDAVRKANNVPLLDSPNTRKELRTKSVCTIKELVRASENGEMGRAIYNYSDFMYCKNLGKVPNNYLITLRRFPFPCDDHINYVNPQSKEEQEILQHAPDIGRMVTWLGTPGNEMSNILKYNFGVTWKELNAQIQPQQNLGNSPHGPFAALANALDPEFQKLVAQGVAGGPSLSMMTGVLGGFSNKIQSGTTAPYASDEWLTMHDQNKIYGPLDVISKTTIRQDTKDGAGGLEFNQEISLVFDYELRSYDGINGKAAFLDLIGNILTTTYTMGTFWGGSIRMHGAHQSNVYANLPIFKTNPPTDSDNFYDRMSDSFTNIWGSIKNLFSLEGLKGIGNMAIGMLMNAMGRPHKFAFNSMLSPAPTGPWHITIGNPKNPIMQMGNMILTDTEIEHYGPLGLDDFPTGIRVTCKLKHGKPRDLINIEKMYLSGDHRIYTPASKDILKLYTDSKDYKNNNTEESKSKTTENTNYDMSSIYGGEISPLEITNIENIDSEKSKFIKFFGTADTEIIIKSAEEGSFGSEKKKEKKNNN